MQNITAEELKQRIDNGEELYILDVREPHEYEIVNLGADLIPLASIRENIDKIDKDIKVVFHCKMGGRSAKAIRELEDQFGLENLYNLRGGILAYIDEVKPELTRY